MPVSAVTVGYGMLYIFSQAVFLGFAHPPPAPPRPPPPALVSCCMFPTCRCAPLLPALRPPVACPASNHALIFLSTHAQ
jgi:hypothetical protein